MILAQTDFYWQYDIERMWLRDRPLRWNADGWSWKGDQDEDRWGSPLYAFTALTFPA